MAAIVFAGGSALPGVILLQGSVRWVVLGLHLLLVVRARRQFEEMSAAFEHWRQERAVDPSTAAVIPTGPRFVEALAMALAFVVPVGTFGWALVDVETACTGDLDVVPESDVVRVLWDVECNRPVGLLGLDIHFAVGRERGDDRSPGPGRERSATCRDASECRVDAPIHWEPGECIVVDASAWDADGARVEVEETAGACRTD